MSCGDVATCCMESLQHVHVHCNSIPWAGRSIGHVARVPWDMMQELHGTCCKGSMGHVVRAPWDMMQGLQGTCCKGSRGHVARVP